MGKRKESIAQLREALRIREAAYGKDSLQAGQVVESMAIAYAMSGDLAGAHAMFERSLSINEKVHGPSHMETIESHGNLGKLLVMRKRYIEALPHLTIAVRGRIPVDLNAPAFQAARHLPGFAELAGEQARLRGKTPDVLP